MSHSKWFSAALDNAKHIVPPQTFSDDQDSLRTAQVITAMSWLGILITLVYSVAWAFIMPQYVGRLIFLPLALTATGGPLILLRLKRVRLASFVALGATWLFVTVVTPSAGGTRAPLFGLYTLIVMLAAILSGWRIAFGLAILAVAAGSVMVALDYQGLIPMPLATPLSAWLTQVALMTILAATAYFAVRRSERTLQHARHELAERKKVEQALQASEARFKALVANSSDIITVLQADGIITFESQSVQRLLGYTPENLVGHSTFEHIHPDDLPTVAAVFAETVQRIGSTVTVEYRIRHANGSWVDLESRATNLLDDPIIRGGVINSRDVTDRKRAEQELQRRDTILRAVSAATNNLLRAAEWQQEIVNVLAILGKAAVVERAGLFQVHGDAQGPALGSLRYEWDAPGISPMLDNPLAQNYNPLEWGLGSLVERLGHRQPAYFHIKDRPSGKPTLGEMTGTKTLLLLPVLVHGAIWGGLMLAVTREEREWSEPELEALQIAVDMLGTVVERKQVEEALHHSAARLNILHTIDRAMLAAVSPEAIAQTVLQPICQLIPCQNACIEFIDLETSERVRLSADMTSTATRHTSRRYPLDTRWIDTFEEGRAYVVADVRSSTELPTGALSGFQDLIDESVRSLAVVPLIAHGRFLGSLDLTANDPNVFIQDNLVIGREVADQLAIAIEYAQLHALTQRHAAEFEQRVKERTVQLEAANKELRAFSHMKDEFVSNVSHELRTPITNLKMRFYLLSKQKDQVDVHLPAMQRETDRLARIIEDLLALSRLDQDRTQFKVTEIDLNSLIRQFAADRVPLAESRRLMLNVAFAPGTLRVQADAGLLEQVLSVLLTNALNYTPAGGQVIVDTQTVQSDDRRWVGFSVRDTGPGINHEEQDKLFSRFFRGRVGRESGVSGTGLGLALAKEIVDRHNGRIEVESEGIPGQGTTFTVWLPGV